jgi:hypothetical protein
MYDELIYVIAQIIPPIFMLAIGVSVYVYWLGSPYDKSTGKGMPVWDILYYFGASAAIVLIMLQFAGTIPMEYTSRIVVYVIMYVLFVIITAQRRYNEIILDRLEKTKKQKAS